DNADPETPPPGTHCQGGIKDRPLPKFCLFEARGNLVYSNVFSGVGFFGNPSNSDLANETLGSYTPRNCFYGNVDLGSRLTSAPASIESASVDGQPCGRPGNTNDPALNTLLVLGGAASLTGACARPAQAVALTSRQLAGQRVIYSYSGLTVPSALLQQIRAGPAAGVIFFKRNISSEAQIASVIRQLRQ